MAKKKKRNKRSTAASGPRSINCANGSSKHRPASPDLTIKAFNPVPTRTAFAVAGTEGTVPFAYTAWWDAERVLKYMREHSNSSFWDMIVSVTKPSELKWLQTANGIWRGEVVG